jgi:hypothetical protein
MSESKSVHAAGIVGLIPDDILDRIADETGADYSVEKLHGKVVFKLFLYGILTQKKISLRILEEIFNSEKFRSLFKIKPKRIRHSAIGTRLANIDYRYFERIFKHLLADRNLETIQLGEKRIVTRKIDSTMVTLSAKLISFGMVNGEKKNLKFSLDLSGGLPVRLMLFTGQSETSEDIALPQLIIKKPRNHEVNIAIFDRGIRKKKTFVEFEKRGIWFISRLGGQTYEVIYDRPVAKTNTETLSGLKDQLIRFKKQKTAGRVIIIPQTFRLVTGKSKETGEIIQFITNVEFLSAGEIADLYRSRWEIETFFRFIKQELNFSHLLSRTENGVKSVMYLTMIAAILLTLYRKANKISSWAAAKIRFVDELERDLLYVWHTEIAPIFERPNQRLP